MKTETFVGERGVSMIDAYGRPAAAYIMRVYHGRGYQCEPNLSETSTILFGIFRNVPGQRLHFQWTDNAKRDIGNVRIPPSASFYTLFHVFPFRRILYYIKVSGQEGRVIVFLFSPLFFAELCTRIAFRSENTRTRNSQNKNDTR